MGAQERYNERMKRERRRAEKCRKAFGEAVISRKKVFISKEFYE